MRLMHWIPLGDSAVLFRVADAAAAGALARRLAAARPDGFIECVPAFDSVAICFDPLRVTASALVEIVTNDRTTKLWRKSPADAPRDVVIPVCYDTAFGPDLADVAARAGLDIPAVIKLHAAGRYLVGAIGFMPGFPYLSGLDPRLHTPRRATPRTLIPAGAVGIGGAQTGVYPLASPGGWNLIGRTPLALFRPDNEIEPTLLRPGDTVRFRAITPEEFGAWK
jgi:inhibitor of KinA